MLTGSHCRVALELLFTRPPVCAAMHFFGGRLQLECQFEKKIYLECVRKVMYEYGAVVNHSHLHVDVPRVK